jgi:hypothetical protein
MVIAAAGIILTKLGVGDLIEKLCFVAKKISAKKTSSSALGASRGFGVGH